MNSENCTCRSFPDRHCGCHLPGESHKDCRCSCPYGSPTRGNQSRERVDIENDYAWWQQLAVALNWICIGFSWREHATFLDTNDVSIQITGHQRTDILNAISPWNM